MVVTKPSVKHLHRNVAALLLEDGLDWKFLWQAWKFGSQVEVGPKP